MSALVDLDLAAYVAKHVCRGGKGLHISKGAAAHVCNACGKAAPYCAWLEAILPWRRVSRDARKESL